MQESRAITRKSASNLALAFVLLPKAKRDGMSALYAFCREVDDVADDESLPSPSAASNWPPGAPMSAAPAARRPRNSPSTASCSRSSSQYHLPFEHFDALLQGVEMDLDIKRYEDYEQLELYCYRVASVVGLLSIEVFGYQDPACRDYAVCLGKALQLTNILRDVRTDAQRGRIYLPLSELARFKVSPEEILRLEYSPRFCRAGQQRGAARPPFLSARPRDPARRRPPFDGRRRIDGVGLLAAVAQAGAAALQRLRPRADAPEQRAKGAAHSALLVAVRLRRRCRPIMASSRPNPDSTPRRLIVNADDFGRSASINQAVIRAHREGILTTASLMVNEPAFEEAVALARENPTLGVGLHLTLLCGHSALPPEEIPGLVNARGEFSNNPPGAGFRYFFQRSLREQLRREIHAQFQKFRATRLPLDHVNGHLHLHLHPTVFRILMATPANWASSACA